MAIIMIKNTPFTVGCAFFIVVAVCIGYLYFLNDMDKKAMVIFNVPKDVKIMYKGQPLSSLKRLNKRLNKTKNKDDSITYILKLPLGRHVLTWSKAGKSRNTVDVVITNTDKTKFFMLVDGKLQEALKE